MNKSLIRLFLLLALLIVLNSNAFTQTKNSTTATESKPIHQVKTDETIGFLILQTENARDLIEKQEARIKNLETEIALEKENSESLQKSYELAKSEIAALKQSNEALARAVALNEQTIKLLSEDRENWRQKAKRANQNKLKAYAVAAGAVLIKLLL